jgi:capsular exopolysaccharide synthesis family protein
MNTGAEFFEPDPGVTTEKASPLRSLGSAFDVRRWMIIIRRRFRLMAMVGGGVMFLTIVVTLLWPKVYTATASVAVNNERELSSPAVPTTDAQQQTQLLQEGSLVDTELEVLKSPELADRVVTLLKLDKDPEFNTAIAPPTLISEAQGVVGAITGAISSLFTPPPPPLTPAEEAKAEHLATIDTVSALLVPSRVGTTYAIHLDFTSLSATRAAQISNAFADQYLALQEDQKSAQLNQSSRWLLDRVTQLRAQVEAADAEVTRYKVDNNLLSSAGTTLTEQELSNYNEQAANARTAIADAQARLDTAKAQLARGSKGEDIGEVIGSPLIQNLKAQRAQAATHVADLAGRYGPKHPDLATAQRQLAEIDAQITAEINRIVTNLEADLRNAKQRAGAIQASVNGANAMLATNNRADVKLQELQRNADAAQALYEAFLARYKETLSQEGTSLPNSSIVAYADVPTQPSAPKLAINLVVGLALAMAAAGGSLLAAEVLDRSFTNGEQIEERLYQPYLGSVPLLSSVPQPARTPIDQVLAKPLSVFSEALRGVRTSILHARPGRRVKVVLLTSALPGEGKTVTACCLTLVAAQQGHRVLLIDCDLRRRQASELLVPNAKVGLAEVLRGTATLDEAVLHDEASGAYILPLSGTVSDPTDMFDTQAMSQLLQAARTRYEMVILDSAPVLAVADSRILAPQVDTVVMLMNWRKTSQNAAECALQLLESVGAHLAGCVLTMVDLQEQARNGYGDAIGFYGKYAKYYQEN